LVVRSTLQSSEVLEAIVKSETLTERLEAMSPKLAAEEAVVVRMNIQMLQENGILTVRDLFEALQRRESSKELLDLTSAVASYLRLPTAALPLAQAFLEEPEDGLVWALANALVRLRSPEGNTLLLDLLETGTSTIKQTAAAYVLGWIGGPPAIPILQAAALDPDRHVDVRAHATEALGVLKAQQAVPNLITLLSSEHPALRYWAAYALGEIGDPSSIAPLQTSAAIDGATLVGDRSVGQEALDAIGRIRGKAFGETSE
jgi:hypothetical protein